MSKRPETPLGPALDDDAADLDLLALVTPEDIRDAQALARQRMGPRGRALLEAERAEEAGSEYGTDHQRLPGV